MRHRLVLESYNLVKKHIFYTSRHIFYQEKNVCGQLKYRKEKRNHGNEQRTGLKSWALVYFLGVYITGHFRPSVSPQVSDEVELQVFKCSVGPGFVSYCFYNQNDFG